MIDSVLYARDKYLKPQGTMWPSHATLVLAAISYEEDRIQAYEEYAEQQDSFSPFAADMKELYGVNMDYLRDVYERENLQYYIFTSLWKELKPKHVLGNPSNILTWDLHTVTLAEVQEVRRQRFHIRILPASAGERIRGSKSTLDTIGSEDVQGGEIEEDTSLSLAGARLQKQRQRESREARLGETAERPLRVAVSGLAGWFTVDFGDFTSLSQSEPNPRLMSETHTDTVCSLKVGDDCRASIASTVGEDGVGASSRIGGREGGIQTVTLSTGPESGYTHWGQQVFYFPQALQCTLGEWPERGWCLFGIRSHAVGGAGNPSFDTPCANLALNYIMCALSFTITSHRWSMTPHTSGDHLFGEISVTRRPDNPRTYNVENAFIHVSYDTKDTTDLTQLWEEQSVRYRYTYELQ